MQTNYLNSDGTHSAVVGTEPLNAKTDDGHWVPAETNLDRAPDGSWELDAHPLNPKFASDADEPNAFSVSRGGYEIGFSLVGAHSSSASRTPGGDSQGRATDVVTYPNVLDNTDLAYEVTPAGVKQSLILNGPSGRSEWSWRITANAFTVAVDDHGVLNFTDRYGQVKFHIPAPLMWDSSSAVDGALRAEDDIKTSVQRDADEWVLTLTADSDWLEDPQRVYPVTIDPPLVASTPEIWIIGESNMVRSDTLIVGKSSGPPQTTFRSAVKFSYTGLLGRKVTSAAISIQWQGGTSGGPMGGPGGTQPRGGVYAGAAGCTTPAFGCLGEKWGSYAVTTGSQQMTPAPQSPMSRTIAQSVAAGQSSIWAYFDGDEIYRADSYQQLGATLTVDWRDFPLTPITASPSPANGAIAPIMPTFNAVTGVELYYRYQVGTSSNLDASSFYTSSWSGYGGTAQQQVPQGILQAARSYYWRVQVKDFYDGDLGVSSIRSSSARTVTTNTPAWPAGQGTAVPGDRSIVTTTTPILSVGAVPTDPNGPIKYQFRLATGTDGKTGSVTTSGWLTSPSWAVPAGSLQDGVAYTWMVVTSDGVDLNYEPSWVNSFKVDLRMGTAGPSPFETCRTIRDSSGPSLGKEYGHDQAL